MIKSIQLFFTGTVFFLSAPLFVLAASSGDVVINEIAWMGTKANSADEWVELKNTTAQEMDLSGFGIYKDGGSVLMIGLTKKIPANGLYLIERTDDGAVADVTSDDASPFAASGLSNNGEYLVLKDAGGNVIDSANFSGGWLAGVASPDYKTMERDAGGWHTNDGVTRNGMDAKGNPIYGTPKAPNSTGTADSSQTQEQNATSTESVVPVAQGLRAVNPFQADAGENSVVRAHEEIFFDSSRSHVSGMPDYFWNFGDGAVHKGKNATHRYQFPGTYIATLTIADSQNKSEDQVEVRVYADAVTISEFMPYAQEGKDAWIELANGADYSVDLSGWGLGMKKEKPDYIIPENTFIEGKGFLVLASSSTRLALNNEKGTVTLFYPNGHMALAVGYEKPEKGFSASLKEGVEFIWSARQTPGMKNIVASASAGVGAQQQVFVGSLPHNNALLPKGTSKFVSYEKHGGVKSFLGEPAFAQVVSNKDVSSSREEKMAFAGGAFPWTMYIAILTVFAAVFFGIRYINVRK